MITKRSLGLVSLIIALISIEFSFIYVPEEFETHHALLFRTQITLINSMAVMARGLGKIKMGVEPILFRNYIKMLSYLSPQPAIKDTDSIHYQDMIIDNDVNVRLYTPKSIINSTSLQPALIYFHGGAFVFGSVESYHYFIYRLAERINFKIISVDYKLAPENPYPHSINDGIKVVKYLIKNSNKFQIDKDRLIFGGDSAGGSIAMVLTQKFSQNYPSIPKLQVLIYPWTQSFNIKLPSHVNYRPNSFLSSLTFSESNFAYWYLGESDITEEMNFIIETNSHVYAIDDEKTRQKFNSYVNVNLIPDKYKEGKHYYKNHQSSYLLNSTKQEEFNKIIKKNPELKAKLLRLFNSDYSPGLADDKMLKSAAKSYFVILEWDPLKDDGLIYSERLRRNNCIDLHNNCTSVQVDYYENAFHGIISFIDESYGLKVSQLIFDNLTNFIKLNI